MAVYTKTGDQGTTGLYGGRRVGKGDWLVNVIGQVDELNSQMGLAVAMMEGMARSQELRSSGVKNSGRIEVGLASLIGQLRDVQRELFEMGSALAGNTGTQDHKITGSQQQKDLKARETQRLAEAFVQGKSQESRVENQELKPRDEMIGDVEERAVNKAENESVKFDVNRLEQLIDEMENDLPRLANFILPGGGVVGAQLMVCRSVCRRCEREFVRYVRSKIKNQKLKIQIKDKKEKKLSDDNVDSDVSGQLSDVGKYLNRLSDYLFVASRWVNWLMEEEEMVWKRD